LAQHPFPADSQAVGSRQHTLLPKVSLSNFEAVRAVADGGRPIIVVMVHSLADAVINRVVAEAKIPWTLLAASLKGVAPKVRQLGLRGEVDVIPRNNDALLAIRQRLGAGRSICACIDFAYKTGAAAGYIFVSPTLFELAKLTGSRIVYADASVANDGTIELVFAAPRVDVAASPAEACAEDFID
jgi:lauroyl/myristoyl acyltransferase